ncbi:hypothetical protein Tco_0835653 [Tanacetum coccineum]
MRKTRGVKQGRKMVKRLVMGLEVGWIRRIQELDTAYWEFLGVGTTLDIFQNIILIPYLEYDTLFDVINYALMAYSSSSSNSDVSNDSNCLKSCMETVKLLKSQNDQLLRDLEKSSLMVLGYKTGEITIRELRKKLEKIQKEKDSIQFNVDKFENASNSLNKLIECQIVDNCKKGLGYEKYNAVSPLYIGNFMPPTPDLSFTRLDEFVNKPIVENRKSDEEVSKVVRKSDDSLFIED